jgi:hypothetical protein
MLIPRYVWLREQKFVWWAPVVLEQIVAHLMIFVQLLIEAITFKDKVNQWKYDIMFKQ